MIAHLHLLHFERGGILAQFTFRGDLLPWFAAYENHLTNLLLPTHTNSEDGMTGGSIASKAAIVA